MRRIDGIGAVLRRLGISWNAVAKDRRGIAAVEFAILVPVLILMAVCTTDLGLAVYANMRVADSAEAGSGYAMLHGFDSTAIASAVTSAGNLSGLAATPAPTQFCGCPGSSGITSAICGSTCSGGNSAGTYVRASATVVYHTLMTYPIIPSQYTFASNSTVRIK
ncbi:MAG: TadE/TadG family type IV pilus assembly protein [Rhizomicrobium sp.]|jgi:Flp pilus assembly protein TadG